MLIDEMFDVLKKMDMQIIEKDLEIERLKKKINLIEQYIEVYEDFIQGGNNDGDRNQSGDIREE